MYVYALHVCAYVMYIRLYIYTFVFIYHNIGKCVQ